MTNTLLVSYIVSTATVNRATAGIPVKLEDEKKSENVSMDTRISNLPSTNTVNPRNMQKLEARISP